MLAILAIFAIASFVASIFVIAATMLSSRLSHEEDHYLAESYEVEQSSQDAPAGRTSQSPS